MNFDRGRTIEMKKLITRFSGVLIVIGFAAISLAAQSPVGYVVEIEGNWVLNGSNALSLGEKLPAAGSIRRQSSSRDDRITIADMRGNVLEPVSRNCGNGNCSGVITLPRQARASSLWNVAFDTVMEAIWGSPNRYSAHRSRSGEISDGVVKLTDGKIDLSSVLKIQGDQHLRWRVISQKEDSAAEWTKPVKLEKTALVSGFQPGLYEINLVRSNGGNYEPVASAWILVATAADYEKAQASFRAAQELTKTWGDKVRPESMQLFLQASLDNLARKAVK